MSTPREIVGLIVAQENQVAEAAAHSIRDGGLIGKMNRLFVATKDPTFFPSIPGVESNAVAMAELFRANRNPWDDGRRSDFRAAPPFVVYFLSKDVPTDIGCTLEAIRERECVAGGALGFLKVPLSAVDPRIETAPRRQPIETDVTRLSSELSGADGPILLVGPTGTGKTETAHLITRMMRPEKILHIENCAAIQENDREARFRGVGKGAFTGTTPRPSIFKAHDGGTILLDDFQDLSPKDQATLLDLLDPFSSLVRGSRLGDKESPWEADVQILVAVNRPLGELLESGVLRRDIFYRLPRKLKLTTMQSVLTGIGSTEKAQALLRHRIVSMQERAIRLHAATWEALGNRKQLFLRATGFLEGDGKYVEAIRTPVTEDMPIPDAYITHAWEGNWRELDAVARALSRMNNGMIGKWSDEDALTALEAAVSPSTPTQSRPAVSHGSNARRMLSLAYLHAIKASTMEKASRQLDMDARTLKTRLQLFLNSDFRASISEALTEAERQEMQDHAIRLVQGTGLRNHRN